MAGDGVAAGDRALTILDVFGEGDERLTLTEIPVRAGSIQEHDDASGRVAERIPVLKRHAAKLTTALGGRWPLV